MATVTLVLEADEAKYVRSMLKAREQEEKHDQSIVKKGRTSRRVAGEMQGDNAKSAQSVEKITGNVQSMLGKLGLTIGVVSTIRAAFQGWRKDVEEFSKAASNAITSTSQIASNFADPQALSKLTKFVDDMKNVSGAKATSPDQRRQALQEIINAVPSLNVEQTMTAAQGALELRGAGFDPVQAARMKGMMMQQFGATSMSDKEFQNMTAFAMQSAGGQADKLIGTGRALGQAVSAGLSPEQALGVAISGLRKTGSAEGTEAVLRKLAEQKDFDPLQVRSLSDVSSSRDQAIIKAFTDGDAGTRQRMFANEKTRSVLYGRNVTDQEMMERQFYGMNANQRLANLSHNRKLRHAILGEQALKSDTWLPGIGDTITGATRARGQDVLFNSVGPEGTSMKSQRQPSSYASDFIASRAGAFADQEGYEGGGANIETAKEQAGRRHLLMQGIGREFEAKMIEKGVPKLARDAASTLYSIGEMTFDTLNYATGFDIVSHMEGRAGKDFARSIQRGVSGNPQGGGGNPLEETNAHLSEMTSILRSMMSQGDPFAGGMDTN